MPFVFRTEPIRKSGIDDAHLDRVIATVESLQALYEQAKDGDPAALEQLLAQTQAALDQSEQLRSRYPRSSAILGNFSKNRSALPWLPMYRGHDNSRTSLAILSA